MADTENPSQTAGLVPFKPGTTGNPGGRPKGLARLVREECGGDEGVKMVRMMWGIACDEKRPARDRMAAISWCADRGWGKAVDHVVVESTGGGGFPSINLDRLSLEQLRQLRDLYDVANPPTGEVTDGGS